VKESGVALGYITTEKVL